MAVESQMNARGLFLALALATASVASLTSASLSDGLEKLGFKTPGSAFARPSSTSSEANCTDACSALQNLLGKQNVLLPGSETYADQAALYWSNQQAEQTPYCYVTPAETRDVAAAVLVAEYYSCPFASKSGGHAAFAGASNIDNGFTIDFKNMKQVELSRNGQLAHVGPGNHWVDVYDALQPKKLSVVGGRVAAIGVGGLTTGGGISFFSGLYGWACDNVRNYEVVLSGGRILDVNQTSYPDLYHALRGGGNNFGIVTRFDLITLPQNKLWGGQVAYPASLNASAMQVLHDFAFAAPSDPKAAVYVAVAYYQGQFFLSNSYVYTKPTPYPAILSNFTALKPNLTSSLRVATLANLTRELNNSNPSGLRETYWTATYAMDVTLMRDIVDAFASGVDALVAGGDVPGLVPALILQPITQNTVRHMSKNGGNALGLSEADAPYLLLNLAIMWADEADDERVMAFVRGVLKRSRQAAKRGKKDLNRRYVYMNYAAAEQDVFDGYGEASLESLRATSKKYDPSGVFQRLVPGYFKLGI